MIHECPICELRGEAQPCPCGYDFETGDRSRAGRRALVVKARSTRKAWFGAGLLASIPATVLVVLKVQLDVLGPILFFAILAQLLVGTSSLIRGLAWRNAAHQRWLRATQPAALPPARVVE